MSDKKNTDNEFKEGIIRGFQEWLSSIDVNPDNFDKDIEDANMYELILLLSLFDNYRLVIQQAMRQRDDQKPEMTPNMEPTPKKETNKQSKKTKKETDNKNGESNIITPDFGQ